MHIILEQPLDLSLQIMIASSTLWTNVPYLMNYIDPVLASFETWTLLSISENT